MSNVTMADLGDGVRVRHPRWGTAGTVRVVEDVTEIHWDGSFVADQVSDDGPVIPEDLEIVGQATP